MTRARLLSATVLFGVVTALPAARAWADGMFVWKKGVDLVEPTQRAIISWNGKTETLILAVKYEGPAEDFAWVVPLPDKPEVKAIDADKNPFAEMSLFTQIRERYAIKGSRGGGSGEAEPVEVLERKIAGVYDIAILAAKDPKALADWLKKNGYAFPDKRADVLEHYTKKEWVYAAMRIDPKQLGGDEAGKLRAGELQPVGFTFASKEMVYPLKISSANAGETEVLLYLVADAPMVLATGPAAKGLEPDAIVPHSYRDRAFDPQYLTPKTVAGKELPLTWEALGLAEDAAPHLCKYRAVYKSEEMRDDLAFKPFEPLAYWKSRLEKANIADTPVAAIARRTARRFLAALPQTDDPVFRTLTKDEDAETRRILAANPRARLEQLQALASDEIAAVRRGVVTNPTLPTPIRDRLATDDTVPSVRQAAAETALPAEVQRRVAKDTDLGVRIWLARNRAATAEVLGWLLADGNFEVRLAAAANESLPETLRSTLAENTDAKVRAWAASRPQTGADVLTRLAKDPSAEVRLAVAVHARTPVAVLEQMAADSDANVRYDVAYRKELSEAVRIRLATDAEWTVRRAVAGKPLPEEILRRLAGDADARVRLSVGLNPEAGAAILGTLAADRDKQVRAAVASNPGLPADIVTALAGDPEPEVRSVAARSPKAAPALLAKMAQDADVRVRQAVAGNPRTGQETLALLAQNTGEDIWCTLAARADATPELIRTMARRGGLALSAAARNPQAPVDVMQEAAKASYIGDRAAVADNPNAPEDLLRTLAKDPYPYVARRAQENLSRRTKP